MQHLFWSPLHFRPFLSTKWLDTVFSQTANLCQGPKQTCWKSCIYRTFNISFSHVFVVFFFGLRQIIRWWHVNVSLTTRSTLTISHQMDTVFTSLNLTVWKDKLLCLHQVSTNYENNAFFIVFIQGLRTKFSRHNMENLGIFIKILFTETNSLICLSFTFTSCQRLHAISYSYLGKIQWCQLLKRSTVTLWAWRWSGYQSPFLLLSCQTSRYWCCKTCKRKYHDYNGYNSTHKEKVYTTDCQSKNY